MANVAKTGNTDPLMWGFGSLAIPGVVALGLGIGLAGDRAGLVALSVAIGFFSVLVAVGRARDQILAALRD